MFLAKIAQKNMKESLDGWDKDSKDFIPNSFSGRIALTDRFLTIYNRPTRKRQLYIKPDEPMPDSGVFRHPSSGDIYMIGQERQDARYDVEGGNTYVKLVMCHLVTPKFEGSSGLAKLWRRVPKGPANDPGWLVNELIEENYLDIEFRTSAAEVGVYDSKVENFYAWMPISVFTKQWDFLELNGMTYRVVDTFTDIGLRGLRLDRESDPRIDVTITTTEERKYNKELHRYEGGSSTFNITVIIPEQQEFAHWGSSNSSTIQVVVESDHIGFVPKEDMIITYEGRERVIRRVSTDANLQQYRMYCE